MGQIDPGWVQVLLTLLGAFSSVAFFFIRMSIGKITDQMLSQKADYAKSIENFNKQLNSIEITLAVLRSDIEHLED